MYTKIKIQDSTEKKIVRSTFIIYESTNILAVGGSDIFIFFFKTLQYIHHFKELIKRNTEIV